MTLTRAFNPAIMTWAAMWAICFSFVGKLGAVLQTIPTPVMGGILVLPREKARAADQSSG